MSRRLSIPIWLLMLVVLSVAASPAVHAQEEQVRVLVLVDTRAPVQVDYRTRGRQASATIGAALLGLPTLIEAGVAGKRAKNESARLQQAVGGFDRYPVVASAVVRAFQVTPFFDASVAADPAVYRNGKRIDFARVRRDGYRWVLVVREEFAGMITAWEMATLSAGTRLQYELHDANSGKRLADGLVNGFTDARHDFEAATSNRDPFVEEYPPAVNAACLRIYGELNKHGHLHAMAAAQGLGELVPPLELVLDRYAGGFDYRFALPAGWRETKGLSKYTLTLEPDNDDKMKFGVGFAVDLLIREFGQDVRSEEEYLRLLLGRLQQRGYAVDRAEAFEGFPGKDPYLGVMVDRPNGGGREVVLVRRLSEDYIAIFSFVFIEDFEGFLRKYRGDPEALITNARISVRPAGA